MKKKLTETAYHTLREMVLSNELEVGHYYLEEALAERLQISRTPLREACIRLSQEGLVDMVPRRGVFIKPISLEELKEIYEVIAALELQSIRLLQSEHCQGEDWEALRFHVEELNRALKEENKEGWMLHDTGFHLALIRLCGNQTLASLTQHMLDKSQRIRLLTFKVRAIPKESTDEHTRTFQAMENGDFEEALNIHELHRKRSSGELVALLKGIAGLIDVTSR
ncbi:putative HTH-type transcriptional regulator YdfH [Grimontia celer]|uniref:Putative HTH-type transcriptional regulator YdfH n=1 Tax=Grimontia celer TaxID=1796497 RepID=A0A128F5G9_9GAMM|nr:GntR family transcriptional regulator [Grimontia celer]CZF81546.1 putative HTH-type transcriptional regulator YdfH [Grimontia celer]